MTGTWPADPRGDMSPILQASLEAAKMRHPSNGAPGVVLTATDRCDACGAAAGYRVSRNGGAIFDFCAHHWRRHFPKMVDEGWVIIGANPDVIQERP